MKELIRIKRDYSNWEDNTCQINNDYEETIANIAQEAVPAIFVESKYLYLQGDKDEAKALIILLIDFDSKFESLMLLPDACDSGDSVLIANIASKLSTTFSEQFLSDYCGN